MNSTAIFFLFNSGFDKSFNVSNINKNGRIECDLWKTHFNEWRYIFIHFSLKILNAYRGRFKQLNHRNYAKHNNIKYNK